MKEIPLHPDDVLHPVSYAPHHLHSDLTPVLARAKYDLQGNQRSNIGVYICNYSQTEPASSASQSSLSYDMIEKEPCEAEDILTAQGDIEFKYFHVPVLFVDAQDLHDLLDNMESVLDVDEMKALIQTTRASRAESILSFKGNEEARNSKLIKWLKVELQKLPDEYKVLGNESSGHKCSRFHRSQEDFSWFIIPSTKQLHGACASSYTEDCELIAASRDCKEQEKASDMFQLIANMNKTAADIGYEAVQNQCLFNKIIVYGLLVDYNKEKITKVYELTMNFVSMRAHLRQAHEANLDITDGFLRTTSLLKNSLVST